MTGKDSPFKPPRSPGVTGKSDSFFCKTAQKIGSHGNTQSMCRKSRLGVGEDGATQPYFESPAVHRILGAIIDTRSHSGSPAERQDLGEIIGRQPHSETPRQTSAPRDDHQHATLFEDAPEHRIRRSVQSGAAISGFSLPADFTKCPANAALRCRTIGEVFR